ncbi:hypothetical protein CSV71_05485 [Sporosarcina sp. P21c]|nr:MULTISPECIES: hypothetical protein [unclassified Sporosarcina]PIC66207.1 hypothetical protein CSV78_13615 [Sporosarcina sp. P16a]PIC90156.1 hypothetical protein CSV71_05485 [Sporosarcina sp. P21c]PIC91899.1 hypothetical protein CSV70_13445 [Sporosarcina sp. P25]
MTTLGVDIGGTKMLLVVEYQGENISKIVPTGKASIIAKANTNADTLHRNIEQGDTTAHEIVQIAKENTLPELWAVCTIRKSENAKYKEADANLLE